MQTSGPGGVEIDRNWLVGNYTYGIGWRSAYDGTVDRNASWGNRICQIHLGRTGLSVATRGYWGSPTGPAGDVPTCRPGLLDPIAVSPHAANTAGIPKKARKRIHRRPQTAWPLR